VADIVGYLGKAIEIAKKLREVGQKIKDAETQGLVADLNLALADLKMELANIKEENLALKQQVKQLSEKPDVRANIEVKDGLYYLKDPMPGRPIGPYCPRCLDVEDRIVPLSKVVRDFELFGKWQCPQCKQHFA
jgi:hypothetical protein